MGLFDVFKNKDGKIRSHHRRVTNRDAPDEDREASSVWLARDGSPKALLALFARFDLHLDHQLKDSTEKDYVQELLVAQGQAVIEPARVWLRQCKSPARPMQVLSAVAGDDALLDVVYELLVRERDGDPFKPDKKRRLLVWLAETPRLGAIEQAQPFLTDLDENVRYAAAEVLIVQDTPETRPMLEGVLTREEEDSNRLKTRIADVFETRRWTLDAPDAVAVGLPERYGVRDGRIARA